jgi:hypothetical protein
VFNNKNNNCFNAGYMGVHLCRQTDLTDLQYHRSLEATVWELCQEGHTGTGVNQELCQEGHTGHGGTDACTAVWTKTQFKLQLFSLFTLGPLKPERPGINWKL